MHVAISDLSVYLKTRKVVRNKRCAHPSHGFNLVMFGTQDVLGGAYKVCCMLLLCVRCIMLYEGVFLCMFLHVCAV